MLTILALRAELPPNLLDGEFGAWLQSSLTGIGRFMSVCCNNNAALVFGYATAVSPIILVLFVMAFKEVRPSLVMIALLIPATIAQLLLVLTALHSANYKPSMYLDAYRQSPWLWIYPAMLTLYAIRTFAWKNYRAPINIWAELILFFAVWLWTFLMLSPFQN